METMLSILSVQEDSYANHTKNFLIFIGGKQMNIPSSSMKCQAIQVPVHTAA